jgi:hypothetical protein
MGLLAESGIEPAKEVSPLSIGGTRTLAEPVDRRRIPIVMRGRSPNRWTAAAIPMWVQKDADLQKNA